VKGLALGYKVLLPQLLLVLWLGGLIELVHVLFVAAGSVFSFFSLLAADLSALSLLNSNTVGIQSTFPGSSDFLPNRVNQALGNCP